MARNSKSFESFCVHNRDYYQGLAPLLLCACRQQERTPVDSGQIVVRLILQRDPDYSDNGDDSCPASRCEAPDPG